MNSLSEHKESIYNFLIDILRLIELWTKYKNDLQSNVQIYAQLKMDLGCVEQKHGLFINISNLNKNYLDKNSNKIALKMKNFEIKITELIKSFNNLIKDIDCLIQKLAEFITSNIELSYFGILKFRNSESNKGVSLDIVFDFLLQWKDCIESDIKVQNEVFKLIYRLRNYHTKSVQASLSYFQYSPYGDIFEEKDIFINVKGTIREFITQ